MDKSPGNGVWPAYVSAVGLVTTLIVVILLGKPLYWAMAAGTLIAWLCASVYARRPCGNAHRDIGGHDSLATVLPAASAAAPDILLWAVSGVSRILNVLVLVVLIAAMTSTWFASGTIQGLIYYGLSVIGPDQVLVAGFVLTTLVSLILGSSVGTVTTVGIAVTGIAGALGVPVGPVAGALVSGAIFGDRVSLLSPILHLMVDTTGAKQDKVLKRVALTGGIAWAVSLAGYLALGARLGSSAGLQGLAWRTEYLVALREAVRISPVVIVPPVLVVLLAARKVPVRTCLLLGLVAGSLIALLYQGATPVALIRYAVLGFRGESCPSALSEALRSSGLAGAVNMALLLLFAGAYTGIMESSDMMGAITGGLVGKLRSRASFLAGAMALSAASSVLASNQALSVVIPARVLSDKGREMGVPPESLAGAFADSGVALAGVIPWNLMAAISSQALQCPVVVYAPYAFLALALPIVGAMLILVEAWTDRHRASIKA